MNIRASLLWTVTGKQSADPSAKWCSYIQPEICCLTGRAAFFPEELRGSWVIPASTWIKLLMFLTGLSSSRIDVYYSLIYGN